MIDESYQGASSHEAAEKVLAALQLSDYSARVPLLEDLTILNLHRVSPQSLLQTLATRRPTLSSVQELELPPPPTTPSARLRALQVFAPKISGHVVLPAFTKQEGQWLADMTSGMDRVVIDRYIYLHDTICRRSVSTLSNAVVRQH